MEGDNMAIDFRSEPMHSRASGLSLRGDKLTKAKMRLASLLKDGLLDVMEPQGTPRVKGQNKLIQEMDWKADHYTITLKAGGKFLYLTEEAKDAGKPSFGEYPKANLQAVVEDLIEQISQGNFDDIITPALSREK